MNAQPIGALARAIRGQDGEGAPWWWCGERDCCSRRAENAELCVGDQKERGWLETTLLRSRRNVRVLAAAQARGQGIKMLAKN